MSPDVPHVFGILFLYLILSGGVGWIPRQVRLFRVSRDSR